MTIMDAVRTIFGVSREPARDSRHDALRVAYHRAAFQVRQAARDISLTGLEHGIDRSDELMHEALAAKRRERHHE